MQFIETKPAIQRAKLFVKENCSEIDENKTSFD